MKTLLFLLLLPLSLWGQILPTGYDTTDVTVLRKPTFTVGYSCRRAGPLWVSWGLSASDLGAVKRYTGGFYPDTTLSAGCERIHALLYARSGYDLGHLCPSADRTASDSTNRGTFVMSNVSAQVPGLNRKSWEHMEAYERSLATRGYRCQIVAGVADSLGTLAGRVVVPGVCWKIIVADGKRRTRIVAVWMPNTDSAGRYPWLHYRVSVSEIERRTGLRFGLETVNTLVTK